MKVYAISDLHLSATGEKPMEVFGFKWKDYVRKIKEDWQSKVTDEDVVLIAGDISWAMKLPDAVKDINYFMEGLKGKVVFIRGNHDYWWQSLTKIRKAMPGNCYVLQNDCIKLGNVIIGGTRGWCVEGSPDFKEEDRKLYNRETERMKLVFYNINKVREEGDKVIAMIHYPPFNVKREDSAFTQLFEQNNVDCVVYGHLHGSDSRTDLSIVKNGINYRLTSCDILNNKLVEIEL